MGRKRSDALMVVHARPPNLGTAKVYGTRRIDPIRFGTSVSRNCSDSDMVMPMLARLMTTMVQMTQTLNPMCSAKIESARLRRAILRPPPAQNCSLSGSQWSIQWPRRGGPATLAGDSNTCGLAGVSITALMAPSGVSV